MSITSLPVEVMSSICSHLQLSDCQALRLSCRALHSISIKGFSKQYFNKSIYFIVTSDSFGELEALARTDGVRERVQELWVIPSVFEGSDAQNETTMSEFAVSSKSCQPVRSDELKSRSATYKALAADSSSLLESEAFIARPRRGLEKFENLDTIRLAHYITSFLLDPRQKEVRFLGWRHLINRIDFRFGSNLMALRGSGSPMDRVNSLAASRLLQALSETNREIRKLSTCNADYCGDISPEISITQPQNSSLLSVLNELEDLHVCTAFLEPNLAGILAARTWVNWLIKFAPRLERLTLSQNHSFRELSQQIELARFKKLHLHKTHIIYDDLKSLLNSAKATLTIFRLFEVILLDDDITQTPSSLTIYSPDPAPTPYSPTPDLAFPHSEGYSLTSEDFSPTSNPNCSTSTPNYYQPAGQIPFGSVYSRYSGAICPALPFGSTYTPSSPFIPSEKHGDILWKRPLEIPRR
jgi:hypothetical protein